MQNLLTPLFQPIHDKTGSPYAFEALLRFKGHTNNSPLPIVKRWEKTGFIRVVDLAMLASIRHALRAAATKPRLTVNVSITTIEGDSEGYLDALRRLSVRTEQLIVELTETAPISNPGAVLRFVAACRACRFLIALDDCNPAHPYGTAAFLGNMRPELVKIDGEFLQASYNTGSVADVRKLIDTAHSFKAKVIAEHISSKDLHEFAIYLGADFVQGYAIGLPAPLPHRDSVPIDALT